MSTQRILLVSGESRGILRLPETSQVQASQWSLNKPLALLKCDTTIMSTCATVR